MAYTHAAKAAQNHGRASASGASGVPPRRAPGRPKRAMPGRYGSQSSTVAGWGVYGPAVCSSRVPECSTTATSDRASPSTVSRARGSSTTPTVAVRGAARLFQGCGERAARIAAVP
ncbi:hypothetical protein ACW4TU_21455 [Streptomyces sp. QTS52]